MKTYAYAGPDPIPDGEGGVVRPGEKRDFGELPPWGPWAEVPDESGAAPEPAPAKASKTAPAPAETPSKGEGEK